MQISNQNTEEQVSRYVGCECVSLQANLNRSYSKIEMKEILRGANRATLTSNNVYFTTTWVEADAD